MSGDDHSPERPRRHGLRLRAIQAAEPAGCVVATGSASARRLHLPREQLLPRRRRRRTSADGFEVGAARLVRLGCTIGDPTAAAVADDAFDTQLAQFGARYTGVPAPLESHPLRRVDPTGRPPPRSSSPAGSGWTRTTTTSRRSWIGAQPGFMTGGGFPMRFADTDGTPIDVYQAEHEHERRGRARRSGDGQRAARQRDRHERLLRRLRGEHAQRLPALNPLPRRSSPPPRHAASRSSPTSSCSTGGRAQRLDHRLDVGTRARSRSPRPSGPAPTGCRPSFPPRARTARCNGLTCGGSPTSYTVQTIKGVQYAMFAAVSGTCQAQYS